MNHIELTHTLSSTVEKTLNKLISIRKPMAHTWFEESFNFGDSAIWNGQVDLIRKLNLDVQYSCSDKDYSANELRSAIGDDGIIMLTGGGNFGGMHAYHKLRLTILDQFKSNPVIQLPQTARFTQAESLAITKQTIKAHGDITLLARDHMTHEIFNNEFRSDNVNIELCPDMAFMSGVQQKPSNPEVDIVGLLRLDNESNYIHDRGNVYNASLEKYLNICLPSKNTYTLSETEGQQIEFLNNVMIDPGHTIEVTDWYLTGISNNQNAYKTLGHNTKAELGVQLALNILSRGRVVVTDRLHAYILCLQMGIPHVVVDNNYGKLSSFHKTWAEDCQITHFVETMEDAFNLAREIVKTH